MKKSPEAVVVAVLDAVEHGNFDALDDLFSAHVVYQDPRLVCHGIETVKAQFKEDQQSSTDMVWETTGIASNNGLVMTERVDKFTMNGQQVSIDIVGVFEVGDDGKVKRWREYFDASPFAS